MPAAHEDSHSQPPRRSLEPAGAQHSAAQHGSAQKQQPSTLHCCAYAHRLGVLPPLFLYQSPDHTASSLMHVSSVLTGMHLPSPTARALVLQVTTCGADGKLHFGYPQAYNLFTTHCTRSKNATATTSRHQCHALQFIAVLIIPGYPLQPAPCLQPPPEQLPAAHHTLPTEG